MKPIVFLLVGASLSVASHLHWSQEDTDRLANVFQESLLKKDLASLHYAASGLKLLKVDPAVASSKTACEVSKNANLKDIPTLYHAVSLAGDLPSCALKVEGAKETIDAVAKDTSATAETIFYALSAADRLSIKVDKAAFDKALTAAVKNTSPSSLAYAISAAAFLEKVQAAKYKTSVASLVKQSDLVDKKYRQYEDGIVVTAKALHGILAWISLGNPSEISPEYVGQFAAYLLSRKHISTEIGAFYLLNALGSLVNNQHHVPITIELVNGNAVDYGKPAKIHISNAFGLPVAITNVKATIKGKGATTTATLTKADSAGILFELPLDKTFTAGFYTVNVVTETQDKRLIGTSQSLSLKIVQEIAVDDLKVGVLDKDALPSGSNVNSVAVFSKLGKVLESDHTKRIYVSLSLKDKSTGKPVKAHQVFVVFAHSSGVETVFTLDAKGNGGYVLDLSLAKSFKDFDGLSGKYSARLVVGDSLFKNQFDYAFADFVLNLPNVSVPPVPKSEQVNYEPLKEIVHVFRQPDKRPPGIVSDTFTLICLAPLALLVIMWFQIGVNFGNMPLSPWVLIFHIGLAGVFGLYFVFWLQLNMFETLKYLAVVGAVTFLSGNRLLRALAEKRKVKSE